MESGAAPRSAPGWMEGSRLLPHHACSLHGPFCFHFTCLGRSNGFKVASLMVPWDRRVPMGVGAVHHSWQRGCSLVALLCQCSCGCDARWPLQLSISTN